MHSLTGFSTHIETPRCWKLTGDQQVELLRTAGAYSKRAAEHAANDRYLDAAADLTRALMRPGLDPQVSNEAVLQACGPYVSA